MVRQYETDSPQTLDLYIKLRSFVFSVKLICLPFPERADRDLSAAGCKGAGCAKNCIGVGCKLIFLTLSHPVSLITTPPFLIIEIILLVGHTAKKMLHAVLHCSTVTWPAHAIKRQTSI